MFEQGATSEFLEVGDLSCREIKPGKAIIGLFSHHGDRQSGRKRGAQAAIGTLIDTYTKVSCAKLYDRKTPITAADLLNDRVLPFFEEHDVKLLRVLTDRGSEFCGNPERHEYELYLAVEDIDHSRTKTKSPQTNGICERWPSRDLKTAAGEALTISVPEPS